MEYSRSIISDSRVSSIKVTVMFFVCVYVCVCVCVCVCETAARLLDSIHKIRFICTPSIKEELKFSTESRYLFKSIVLRDRSENFSPWTCQRVLTNPYLLVLSRWGHRKGLISSQENAVFIILTFRHHAFYIQNRRTVTLRSMPFIYLVNKYI